MDKKFLTIIALLCTVIQGMWAQTPVSLTEDTGEEAGTPARWYINMPTNGTSTLTLDGTITTFKVYDDGGKDGTYSDNCDGTLVLTAPNGYVLQLSGNISSEYNHYLYVYDGSDNKADKLIDGACGNNNGLAIDIPTVISNDQSMTLYFKSIGSYHSAGLNLTVTLINTNTLHDINGLGNVSGGNITAKVNDATVTQAKFRDVVALTASPDDDYVLSNLSVKDASNNDVSVSWLIWSNNATFTMPPSAVTVTPTFTHKNSLSVNMPVDGVKTVRIPAGVQNFKVYDDGGAGGYYSNGCEGTLVLTAPEGYVLQLSGGIATREGDDYLTVYDNNEASGTKLIDAVSGWGDQGNLKDITTVTSTGNNMTLYFYSNITNNYTGLDLTVLVYNPTMEYGISGLSNTTNGSIIATVGGNAATAAKWNDEVILSATPDEGYVLDALSVVDENSNAVDVTWNHWENSASFTMPLSAVTVTSTFTSKNSLSINMPTKATRNVTIPAGVSSFKVYDDGGSTSRYSNNCEGTLVLTAPVGCRLQLSGTIFSYSDDNLSVYNGSDKSAPKLIDEMHSTGGSVVETTSISTVSSTERSMTLYFHTDGGSQLGGLDLTVTVLDASAEYTINGIGDVTNGSIAATVGGEDVTKAKLSDVVTLTVTPADNYVLSDLSVVDANSKTVSVTRDFWANTATFTMPASEVTVTPTFTNDIFVNMPKTGEKTVTIPANVHWFKVYDDGGKDYSYNCGCNGTLVLTAPEGYQLQLSGNITTDNVDYLTVYDGDQADNEHILINQAHSSSSVTSTAISTVFSTGRSMRLYFYSDNGGRYDGLDLTVTVIDPNRKYGISGLGSVTNGSITATVGGINVTQSKASDVVTLTVAPDKGYVLTNLSVVDGSNPVTVTRDFWSNTATFTMPASAVIVTPTLTNNQNDIYINMPKTGTTTVNLPSNVQSFKVYGDKGYDKYYSNDCNGYLVLNVPEGYVLQVSGSIESYEDADYLIVYDGTSDAADVLISKTYNYTGIPTRTSTGRSMTICFVSNSSNNYGHGLNLTVTLINTNTLYDISGIGNVTNGNIVATVGGENATQAKWKDEVTLNITPADGYVLTDLSVVDGSSNAVTVTREFWANTATFTMPYSAVTVTPTFTNEPHIDMPATGERTYDIPAHVSSFKVYDNGGKDGNYSDYCNGTLVLTAPDGYVLQLSGSIVTESYEKLTVYDGIDEHADILIDQLRGDNETSKAIPTVVSTDRYMTIKFESDNSFNYAGLDLTVTLISVNNVQLANDADNSTVISDNNSLEANVTLAGRTLSRSGEWNTLCLPFSLASLTGTPLEGAVVKELDAENSSLANDGTLTLNFTDATSIDAGKPYIVKWNSADLLITSTAEWNTFASNVSSGTENYSGKVVKLGADINVSTMAGTYNYPFKGTFDGDGHKLTVSLYNNGDSGDDERTYGVAPFRFTEGATIKNLTVDGTVSTTDRKFAAGFIGWALNSTNNIENCVSSVEIYSTINGDGTHGGFVGKANGTLNISNCLFNGMMTTSLTNGTNSCGGFVGWAESAASGVKIYNSLYAPATIPEGKYKIDDNNSATFARNGANIDDGYYTESFGTEQGTSTNGATGDDLVTLLGSGWKNDGGNVVPKKIDNSLPPVVNPVFRGVTISSTTPTPVEFSIENSSKKCQFLGQYSPFSIVESGATGDNQGNLNEIVMLGSGSKLGYSKNARALKTFRCHFYVPADGGVAGARTFVMDFGDEDTTTGIITMSDVRSEMSDGWYTIDGRKLSGKPSVKGVYVNNGRKVIIK
ncbi:hypothetical protein SAMN04487900_1343 [Prevotella communis]|uniref:Bacterial repeat domain-containing protein n=1 Tax=Prevotella communis TaxID=2913614 RepID=A0A1H0KWW7_9BACT|nr:hypothetical protein [Prevotella communis]SDO60524.1 hypothetical protein SAMN04487900_1343 [Prevotella communis]